MSELSKFIFISDNIKLIFPYSDNRIGSEGAQALAESLKMNTTLTQFNLSGMSELSEFMFV